MFFLRLFGGVTLEDEGVPIRGRAARGRRLALLSLLATSRFRLVGRERLIGYLWPEHRADAARHLLSESLYILRKELGSELFVVAGDEVGLNWSVIGCDRLNFEEAVAAGDLLRAVSLYHGPFLDAFYVPDAPEFERWAEGERVYLDHSYARALEQLADAAEGAERWNDAVHWWRRLVSHDPYSSRVTLRLMRALNAGGDQAAALRHAAAHIAFLRDDLEVEPSPEVTAFVDQLRAKLPSGTLVIREPGPAYGSEPATPPTDPPSDPPLPPPVQNDSSDGGGHRSHVFISYSHKDQKWLSKLQTMLKPLLRSEDLLVWDDRRIKPGAEWRKEIRSAIDSARVAVLLVSPDFLASDFISEHELPPLLDAAEQRGLRIIWVLLSTCFYHRTEIERYQAAIDPGRPLEALSGHRQTQALYAICAAIEAAFKDEYPGKNK